jgi:4-amino-4-deoxy-L-arabinose transferase-like glycosyltransferase
VLVSFYSPWYILVSHAGAGVRLRYALFLHKSNLMVRISRSKLERVLRVLISKCKHPLGWLAVLYILVGITYILVTPVLEKQDEDGHYGYILYLRKHRTLPPLSFSDGFPSEYKQPPLYYIVTSILTSWLPDVADPDHLLVTNPYMDFSVPGYRNDNRNVFLHPPHMTPLILGARLVSLLFGLGTMIVSYFLALQLFPQKSMVPIATAAVVGFQPKFLYIATAVNNDAAMAFFGALIVTFLIYRLQKSTLPYFAVLLGGLLGLASIIKVSGLVFFPLTGLALLFIHRGSCRAFFRDGVTVVAVALLIGGWWYARNALFYDDPLSIDTHIADDAVARPLGDRAGRDLSSIEHTFWANPSRTFVSRIWLDEILIWWGRISLGLLILGFFLNYQSVQTIKSAQIILLSWPATFLFLLVVYWTRKFAWAYGRFLLPAVAPIALLFVLGWLYIFPPGWRRLTLAFGAGTVVIVSVLTPFVSIYPLYHPWREPAEEQVEYPVGTIYVDPKTGTRIAQLVSYNLPEPFAFPGAYLPVELCWKPFSQTDVPYAVFVHLLDLSQLDVHGSPGMWGSRRTYPGLGNLPTDRWVPGRTFCDRVLTQVSPEAPTPLGAAIEIGLIDPETENRLQTASPEGDPLVMTVVRGVPILSPEELPTVEQSKGRRQPARYILDNAIGLDQVQFMGGLGGSLTLTLTWQSLQPVPYDATTFVHLRGTDGSLLAQVDRQPLGGRFPTSYWLPGQVVTDVLSLSLALGTYDGPLVSTVGMYTWPSLERLPVVDASGTPQRDNVITISIPPLPHAEQMIAP